MELWMIVEWPTLDVLYLNADKEDCIKWLSDRNYIQNTKREDAYWYTDKLLYSSVKLVRYGEPE